MGREKNRKSRQAKKLIASRRDAAFVPSTELLQPTTAASPEKEKIKVLATVSKKKSALIPGEGQSMGMDMD